MPNDYIKTSYKFRRGQIWFVHNPTDDRSFDTSVQAKSRPYLIVSCDVSNEHAPIVNACPCTTRPYDNLPCHVQCQVEDRSSLILLEQITTLSVQQLKTYLCTVPDDVMKSVDRKLAIQLGVEGVTVDKISHTFEMLTNQIKNEIEALQNTPTAIEATLTKQISDLTNSLKDLAAQRASTTTIVSPITVTPTTTPEPIITTPKPAEKPAITLKPSRNTWTPELMEQYLKDYKTMPLTELIAKWNISSKATAVANASVFKKKLRL